MPRSWTPEVAAAGEALPGVPVCERELAAEAGAVEAEA